MRYAGIGQSREWSEAPFAERSLGRVVQAADVAHEARCRKSAIGLDEWRLNEFVSGTPMPERITQLCQQIEFAATALTRMSPIPSDFADDLYWPRVW